MSSETHRRKKKCSKHSPEARLDKAKTDDSAITAEYLSKMVDRAFSMEEGRHASLRELAGTLLTCSSIVSVAMLTIATQLFSHFSNRGPFWSFFLIVVYALSLLSLGLSILFSVLSQLRFAYRALPNPESLRKTIAGGKPFTKLEAVEHSCKALQEIYVSLERRNNLMRSLLRVATICMLIAIVVIIIGGIVLLSFEIFELLSTNGCESF